MTAVLNTRDSVRDAATAAASAACSALAAPATLDSPLTDAELLPLGPGARAVAANLRGAAVGSLVVVVAGELAEALTAGPLGAQDLVAALAPVLAEAGGALQQYCGAPVEVEAPHEVDGAIALAGLDDHGRVSAAVPLRVGTDHVATIALVVEPALVGSTDAIPQPRGAAPAAHDFAPLGAGSSGSGSARPLDLLHDVEMGVTAELGRTRMTVRDLLSLAPGAVVELDRAAGSPVDVLVNGTLIARGEVVVIDEEFGIRISEIVGMRADESGRR